MPVAIAILIGFILAVLLVPSTPRPTPQKSTPQVCASGFVPIYSGYISHVICVSGYVPEDKK